MAGCLGAGLRLYAPNQDSFLNLQRLTFRLAAWHAPGQGTNGGQQMIEITEAAKLKKTATNGHKLKSCCASVYASDWARLLLGDSFHPGGLALTRRLGNLLKLQRGMRVLDLAAGRGTSAIFLAMQFDVEVVGVEYSIDAVKAARVAAIDAGVSQQVRFLEGDAEIVVEFEETRIIFFCPLKHGDCLRISSHLVKCCSPVVVNLHGVRF